MWRWDRADPFDVLDNMARIMFPAGTLPGETDPITFSERELEIFRHAARQTKETEMRMVRALMDNSPRMD